jgi:glycosyltransferase involved in cell wall biosynthesis
VTAASKHTGSKLELVQPAPEPVVELNGPFLSVVVPAFNEVDGITAALTSISKSISDMGFEYEIVLVDDGSVDDTTRAAAALSPKIPIRVVGYNRNMGKGYAIKYGVGFVRGEITLLMDGDKDIQHSNLRDFIKALEYADVAIGSKRHPLSITDEATTRKFLSIGFRNVVTLVLGLKQSDTQCGLKAFRTTAIKRIMPLLSVKKYAFDPELLTVANLLDLKIVELPVRLSLKSGFKSRDVLRMGVDLLGIAYRLRILRWYQKNLRSKKAEYDPIIRW